MEPYAPVVPNTPTASTPGTAPGTRTVLILGANGRFGAAATRAFANAGWQVIAQARRAPASLPPGARHIATPLADPAALASQATGADTVVYAINPPYTRWAAEALPLLHAGLAVAQRLNARFMLPGNVYNFGEAMPPLLREDTPQDATTRKGQIRIRMERELEARAATGLRSVVIRAGDFFGSGTGSWLDLLIARSLRAGKLIYPGPTNLPHAWAYLPDLADAFVAVAQRADLPAFERLHFVGHTLTGAQLLDTIERAAEAAGIRPAGGWRHGGVPWPLLRVGGLFVPMWREIAEMAYLWRLPHALDGRRLAQAAGPLPGTPIDVAMTRALLALTRGSQPSA
ncbi:MAG: epimerase [Burkholderiaceae bacterium]|jgi:nucleoside-diphosphate-sugar epimerase|nr:epimerase [Burkholderiaceae bacterium]